MEAITLKFDESRLFQVVDAAVREALANQQSNVLNKRAAAKYLGISAVTLWKLEGQNVLKPLRMGDREVYTRRELDAFLDAARVKSQAA